MARELPEFPGGKLGTWRERTFRRAGTRACAEIDDKLAAVELDALSARKGREGDAFTLRWVIGHPIEETSRHNGHLDVVRELVDGVKGV